MESAVSARFGHARHLALASTWSSLSSSSGPLARFPAEMEMGVQDCLSLRLGIVSSELNGMF